MSFGEREKRESRARGGEKVAGKGMFTKAKVQHTNRGEGTTKLGPYSKDFWRGRTTEKEQKSRRLYC